MTNQIENENKEQLIGELLTPNEREHLFTNLDAVCDFIKTFKLQNCNIRYGYVQREGKHVLGYQLVYRVEDN